MRQTNTRRTFRRRVSLRSTAHDYAPLAALSAANVALDSGNAEAKTKLEWVIEEVGPSRIRCAHAFASRCSLMKKLDDALTLEAAKRPANGLYHDREGDIWAAKGDLKKAREAWTKAAQATDHQNACARHELKLANLPQEG
ncbi:MAG: tetratricopeptide repeat protein [Sutterella wadsworthensis]